MRRERIRMTGDMSDYPTMTCSKCGHEEHDLDGFGMNHCEKCGWCAHWSITEGVCDACGRPVDPVVQFSDSDIWRACASILEKENQQLALNRVANAANMEVADVIVALLHEGRRRGEPVKFRYPPLPEPALISLGD